MFKWLRRLWESVHPERQNRSEPLVGKDRVVESAVPKARKESRPATVTPEAKKPVIVRGEYWVNTEETRWQLAPEPEKTGEWSVEDLIKRLGRVDRAEIRRSAAEELGQMGPAAVPAISALLSRAVDVDATVRKAALNSLNAIDPDWPRNGEARKAFPNLVSALNSWSPDVSKAALGLLNQIGLPAVPDLVNALTKEEDTVDKVIVIQILARIGPQAAYAVPGLTRVLGSQFLPVRIAAAEALAKMGPAAETAVPALTAGLADKFADGRQAMGRCLANIGAAAVPALLPLLGDREGRVRRAAAAALEQIGPKTMPAFIEIVQARDAQRLEAWFESMIKDSRWYTRPKPDMKVTDDRKALGNLSWAIYDAEVELASMEAAQEAALRVLGKFGPEASMAVPSITQAMADLNPDIQLAAAQALGQIGLQARCAMPNLVQMLIPGNESFRKAAVKALGNIDRNWVSDPGIADAIASLSGQLSSEGDPGEAAVEVFVLIGEAAVPLLIDALDSRNQVTRGNAAKALGQIGPEAKAAIPALTRALEDNQLWVRDEAALALAKIDEQVD